MWRQIQNGNTMKTKSKQREEYEYTRKEIKEIIEWLHEQNWKCEQLEKLILKK